MENDHANPPEFFPEDDMEDTSTKKVLVEGTSTKNVVADEDFEELEDEKVSPMDMPKGHKLRLGDIKVWKAKVRGVTIVSWDAIPPCRGDGCSIWDICGKKDSRISSSHCGVLYEYIGNVNLMIYRNYADQLTEPMLFRVGMHLIPLYKQLCRLKIEELNVFELIGEVKGKWQVHPILKEIRETVKQIEMVWSSLGLKLVEDDNRSTEQFEGDIGRIAREKAD